MAALGEGNKPQILGVYNIRRKMPRGFGISSYMTTLFGRGHQSPEWETWPVAKEDRIKTLRLENAVEKDEKENKSWAAPSKVKQLAKQEGLDITDEQAKEFASLHKERFDRKGKHPWEPEFYPVSVAVRPPGAGSVDPPGGNFKPHTAVKLTAIPAPGYVFDQWTGEYHGPANPITLTMDWPKDLTAHFKKTTPPVKYKLEVKATPKSGGSVKPESGEYDPATKVTITATPATGYIFDRWSGDYEGKDNPTIIVMDGDKTITAHFKKE